MALARYFGPIVVGVAVYFGAKAYFVDGARPMGPEEIERQLMATPAAGAITVLRERAPEDHARVLAALADASRGRPDPQAAAEALQET
ncbi:MAG: hypothetical protein OEM24_11185, partial [Paracoccaceae bacterium]|nr:hypothetical protein [Paracoccaceae bacterium]